ncbi:hypothetical protein J2046_002673 [Rhizobium petrolearium]|uniref:FG-GAP repeat protein n=1 Tax=Neorhizobium petrolearium TaxID=515361 RepID=UPI001AE860DF|nr:FG-GAP repeat protein [Neorhizobium petrolearium]MBP1844414.1 hypothetical protein [Neorhizobium petrolearium]
MRTFAVLVAFLLAGPALTEELIDPGRIAAVATGDFDRDGDADLAMIVRPPREHGADRNGIYIYLADPYEGRMTLKAAATNKVPGSFIYAGESVAIAALQNGSILVTAKNDTPGQRHYEIRLTLAYRNSDFLVAGYGFSENVPDQIECDLNLLTGKGKVNGKPIIGAPGAVPVAQWENEIGQDICKGR